MAKYQDISDNVSDTVNSSINGDIRNLSFIVWLTKLKISKFA